MSLATTYQAIKANPNLGVPCDTTCCVCHAPMVISLSWSESYVPRYFCKICAPNWEWRVNSFWLKEGK
jgi:hypothetical protein